MSLGGSAGGLLRNARTQTCAGITADVGAGSGLVLTDCSVLATSSAYGTLTFDASWLEVTALATVRHGLYSYDRARGPPGYDPEAVTFTNRTDDRDWSPRGVIPYDVSNISTLSVLLAGNSTIEIEASLCGPEGCPVELPVCTTCSARTFKWTTGDETQDFYNWNVTNDPTTDVPSNYWSGTIWDEWVVIVDQDTVFVNKLVVRGTLIFQPDAGRDVTLHAHYVTVDGGRIIMGNSTDRIGPARKIETVFAVPCAA